MNKRRLQDFESAFSIRFYGLWICFKNNREKKGMQMLEYIGYIYIYFENFRSKGEDFVNLSSNFSKEGDTESNIDRYIFKQHVLSLILLCNHHFHIYGNIFVSLKATDMFLESADL